MRRIKEGREQILKCLPFVPSDFSFFLHVHFVKLDLPQPAATIRARKKIALRDEVDHHIRCYMPTPGRDTEMGEERDQNIGRLGPADEGMISITGGVRALISLLEPVG